MLAQFRSGGRFFWPVAYVLVVACMAYLSKWRQGSVWIVALLGSAACLQGYDQKCNWEGNWRMFHQPLPAVVDIPLLSRMFAHADSVNFYPQFGCGLGADNAVAMQALLVASRYAAPINTMHLARQTSNFECSNGLAAPLAAGEVRVVFQGADVASVPGHEVRCLPHKGYSVCSAALSVGSP
ncbi:MULTISPECIES: hypothetical protein [Xanthomonas]|uniref:hypothetical protein n=1 Tax=Xanthomonas TaxID=338 RepID=UPI00225288AB|nr:MULTISPECIES: hypothetical protein [Xanthomonas]MCW0392664.1 hypothetical protein [Xanthomonas sacchari]MDY4282477.1 hypothetical protein [Xanthomonas sp. LF06-19]